MSHLGRPANKPEAAFSLKPVRDKLTELLETDVAMAPSCLGADVESLVAALGEGQVLLLENLRFHPGEKNNDREFAAGLAKLGDIYINDAFATAHRSHASVVGVAELFDEKCAGTLMEKELDYYNKALVDPAGPFCVVIGGAKVSSKLDALVHLSERADKVIIGGAMANTFLAAQGFQMGRSLVEPELYPKAIEIIGKIARRGAQLYLPVDLRAGESISSDQVPACVPAQELPAELMALDIGPATSILYEEAVANASTTVWNGPMGAFENEVYSHGTFEMTKALGSVSGLTVAGGGDTVAAITAMELGHKFDYISTGGGAFLHLMEGKALPGVAALE